MTTPAETIFDTSHYLKLIESRGETIRDMVSLLKPVLKLSTALDAGCGIGFFSEILRERGLQVRAFDGRQSNVNEARRRFPQIAFELGNIEAGAIRDLGQFDLVLCFGLLYHLESPLPAIRNLRSLTGKGLLIESMCFPDQEPWMLLREEPSTDDQSLTDIAFYATEGCLAKMLYRAGFHNVYRITRLPDHDDFRDNFDHFRRRTILFASSQPVKLQGLTAIPEPRDASDPWQKWQDTRVPLRRRIMRFLAKPRGQKYLSVTNRLRRWFPNAPLPHRLHFGAWFLVGDSQVDQALLSGRFESAEILFVQKYLVIE